MRAKVRLAAVGDSSTLAPAARVARALEPGGHSPAAVILTVEPCCALGEPLASVQRKLVEGELDAALCPASRLPLALSSEIEVGAVLRCRDRRYQYVSFRHSELSVLPQGSRIVVRDLPARAQILHRFPRLKVELAAASEAIVAGLGQRVWDAACVPAEVTESDPSLASRAAPIPVDEIIPVVGQGLVVVLLRAAGSRFREPVRRLNERAAEHCLLVERVFLSHLSDIGGTVAAAQATQAGRMMELTGLLSDANGRWLVADQARAPARFEEVVALEIADACRKLARGRLVSNGVRNVFRAEARETSAAESVRRGP